MRIRSSSTGLNVTTDRAGQLSPGTNLQARGRSGDGVGGLLRFRCPPARLDRSFVGDGVHRRDHGCHDRGRTGRTTIQSSSYQRTADGWDRYLTANPNVRVQNPGDYSYSPPRHPPVQSNLCTVVSRCGCVNLYTDALPREFAEMCADPESPTSMILRDRDLATPEDPSYVFETCPR
jgi:hypothetical protein